MGTGAAAGRGGRAPDDRDAAIVAARRAPVPGRYVVRARRAAITDS